MPRSSMLPTKFFSFTFIVCGDAFKLARNFRGLRLGPYLDVNRCDMYFLISSKFLKFVCPLLVNQKCRSDKRHLNCQNRLNCPHMKIISLITWGGGGGGCNPKKTEKKRKKPVPNLKFAVAFGFFRFFFGIFRYFSVYCGTFSVFFGLNFDKKFQSFKNHVNNEVLGGQELPNNILYAYKALQMSYKSYYYQKEPLNKKPLNQSKLAKMEKPKKTEKKPKKPEKNQSQI